MAGADRLESKYRGMPASPFVTRGAGECKTRRKERVKKNKDEDGRKERIGQKGRRKTRKSGETG